MWVASMPTYPHYLPGKLPSDRLVILEDTDQDGKADSHQVFADSLYLPLGFELGQGGVYVTQAPDLVFLKDTNGDDRADLRKTLLSGFGTEDSHHTLSRSEEHTSELQSLMRISYAVFCLKKKKIKHNMSHITMSAV